MLEVKVTPQEIVVENDTITVANAEMRNALVRYHDDAWQLLNEVSPVNVDEVSVDEKGQVVIANAQFAAEVNKRLKGGGARGGWNPVCCGNCGCY